MVIYSTQIKVNENFWEYSVFKMSMAILLFLSHSQDQHLCLLGIQWNKKVFSPLPSSPNPDHTLFHEVAVRTTMVNARWSVNTWTVNNSSGSYKGFRRKSRDRVGKRHSKGAATSEKQTWIQEFTKACRSTHNLLKLALLQSPFVNVEIETPGD